MRPDEYASACARIRKEREEAEQRKIDEKRRELEGIINKGMKKCQNI